MTWRRPTLGDRPWAEKPRGAKTWSGMALLDLAPPPLFFSFSFVTVRWELAFSSRVKG